MPTRNEETGEPNRVDIDGVPIEPDDTESEPYYEFSLYQPSVVEGALRLVGVQNLLDSRADRTANRARQTASPIPTNGGDLAKYLFPHVIAHEHETNPAAKGSEAWGWLPPPLHNEGGKVQTDWLHDFLMDPTHIRPAVVLRMPNFHMSSAEASALVDYFAAKNNADFPYEYNQRRRGDYLASLEADSSGAARRRDEDRHRRQLLREVSLGGRLPADGRDADARSATWPTCIDGCGRSLSAAGSAIRCESCRTPACRSTFRTIRTRRIWAAWLRRCSPARASSSSTAWWTC